MEECVSCGAPMTGRFCARCGEKVLEEADLDWRHHLLEELPHALFELDGALPRTISRLFARPGELADDFVSGRRRGLIAPVRLYVLAFLLYEITRILMGHGHAVLDVSERARLVDPTGLLQRLLDLRSAGFWRDPAREERLAEGMKWLSQAGTFLIAIFLAMVQSVVFIRLRRRYLEHLALALNVTTFFLLCAAAGQLVIAVFVRADALGDEAILQTGLAVAALPAYWFFSIRRFYRTHRRWAALSAVAMTVGNALIASLLNFTALLALILVALAAG